MTSTIEDQMISSLADMERLKEQMMDLQKTKIKEDMERENKVKKIEPNIAVLNDWLKNNKQAIEEVRIYNEINSKYNGHYNPEICTVPSDAEQVIINKIKNECPAKRNRRLSYDPNFMKDFIEANYNIFNLQEKRIHELETRLENLEKIEKITLF